MPWSPLHRPSWVSETAHPRPIRQRSCDLRAPWWAAGEGNFGLVLGSEAGDYLRAGKALGNLSVGLSQAVTVHYPGPVSG